MNGCVDERVDQLVDASGSWMMIPVLASSTCEKLFVEGATRSHEWIMTTSRVCPIEKQILSRSESANDGQLSNVIFVFVSHSHIANVLLLQMR